MIPQDSEERVKTGKVVAEFWFAGALGYEHCCD